MESGGKGQMNKLGHIFVGNTCNIDNEERS
jgi:hypothetical protein